MTVSTSTLTLGNTNITVPALCIGTWAWGDKLFWSYGKDYGENQVQAAFQEALQVGMTFFDTAEIYGTGLSEELLGKFKQQTQSPIQLATKFAPLPWRWQGKAVAEALTSSLKRLQVDRVELYQVHWPVSFLISQETLMNALADEVQQGRVGAIGVSNYSAAQMHEAHDYLSKRGIPLAVNQVRYSLLSRKVETAGIIDAARELGITILAYSPLAQGLLTGKYTSYSQIPTGARKFDQRFGREGMSQLMPVLNLLQSLSEEYDRTPAQIALNWLVAQGVIPIAGAKTAEQVRQNAGALGWSLSQADLAQLERVSRPWK